MLQEKKHRYSVQDDSLHKKEHRYNLQEKKDIGTVCKKVRHCLQKYEMQSVNLNDISEIWNKYNLQEYKVQLVKLHGKREII